MLKFQPRAGCSIMWTKRPCGRSQGRLQATGFEASRLFVSSTGHRCAFGVSAQYAPKGSAVSPWKKELTIFF